MTAVAAPARAPLRTRGEAGLIAAFAACAALVFLNRGGVAFLFPWILPDLGLDNTQLGQLMAATALSWGVSSVGFSLASDAWGLKARTLIVVCTLGFSAVGALSGSVPSFEALLALRVAMGFFEGPVIPLIQATVAKVSPPERRGANLGLVIGGAVLAGAVLAPPVMSGLAESIGWRRTFLATAVPGVMVAFACWAATRSPVGPAAPPVYPRVRPRDALRLAARRNVAIGLVGAITLIGATVASASFLPLYLASIPYLSPTQRVVALMAIGVASSVGGVLVAAVSDRLGRRPCLIAGCACATLAPVAISLLAGSPWWLLAILPLSLVGAGGFTLMIYVVPGDSVAPEIAATVYAVLLFIGEIVGGAAAPVLAGRVADAHGLAAAQLVAAALSGVALLAALFVREPDAKRAGGTPAAELAESFGSV